MNYKFRAFDKLQGVMIAEGFHVIGEVTIFSVIDEYLIRFPVGKTTLERYGDIEIMMCTGLMDKNGKEIYEGDLISVERQNDTIIVECKFGTIERQMGTGFLCDITGFYFERDDGCQTFPIKRNYKDIHDLKVFSIIGNIYQNSELLNQ